MVISLCLYVVVEHLMKANGEKEIRAPLARFSFHLFFVLSSFITCWTRTMSVQQPAEDVHFHLRH